MTVLYCIVLLKIKQRIDYKVVSLTYKILTTTEVNSHIYVTYLCSMLLHH